MGKELVIPSSVAHPETYPGSYEQVFSPIDSAVVALHLVPRFTQALASYRCDPQKTV